MNIKERADLFKTLSHPSRLAILNFTWDQERHGDELAALLNLSPATISHHLSALSGADLLTARREGAYVLFSANKARFSAPLAELVLAPRGEGPDSYRDKVLGTFVKDGRLTAIPAQRKKREVVLAWLAEWFEPGREYGEREVSLKLAEFHEDVSTLRRELIITGLMTRANGVYRRVSAP